MKVKTCVIITFTLMVAFAALELCGPGGEDVHWRSKEYLEWKKGRGQINPSEILKFLHVDGQFRLSLNGKTKEEVMNWFPTLVNPQNGNSDQRKELNQVEGMDFMWIGETHWGIEFQSNRVVRIIPIKG